MSLPKSQVDAIRSSFHVIHYSNGIHCRSYMYDGYPNMLEYLKWLDEMYDSYADLHRLEEDAANAREEHAALKEQMAQIIQKGTDKGMTAPCPCLIDKDYLSAEIFVAAYWKDFVPDALEVILDALELELEEYEEEDEENSLTPSLSTLRARIKEISALKERKDITSARFIDKCCPLIENCVTDYLQHF